MKRCNQNNPPTRSTLASLAFADHMDRLVAGDRTPSSPKRAKMLAGVNPALDRPVILFKDIVEVLHRSMSAVPLQSSLGLELHDGWRITGVLVGVDYPRRRMVRSAQNLSGFMINSGIRYGLAKADIFVRAQQSWTAKAWQRSKRGRSGLRCCEAHQVS